MRGWTHLERQKGGIGLRGPGETQLETDRRLIGKRIRTLTAKLEKLAQRRDTGRQVRKRVPVPGVALIGYTNAGKSTLFRALTGADAYVADQLFATLDPTVRRLALPHTPDLVVADTVGFVRDLPHELVAAFRSTLMEAREADLLLHVVDAADPERDQRIEQVDALVASIGAGAIPQLRVYNKIDRLGRAPELARGPAGQPVGGLAVGCDRRGRRPPARRAAGNFRPGGDATRRRAAADTGPAAREALRAAARAREEALPDGNTRLLVESSHQELEALCREAGVDFATAVSPCLPGAGFVEFKPRRREFRGLIPERPQEYTMAWNDPGKNENPWQRRPDKGPPDLDELLRRLQKRLRGLFGGTGGGAAAMATARRAAAPAARSASARSASASSRCGSSSAAST